MRTHQDRLIETGAGHAAELVFEVFLKQSEILNSIKILPVVVDTPKDIIAQMGTLLETVEIMKSIANPTANNEHSTSTTDLREILGIAWLSGADATRKQRRRTVAGGLGKQVARRGF